MARREEKQQHIEVASRLKEAPRRQTSAETAESASALDDLCTAMWTMEEELVDEHAHRVVMQNLERADQTRGVRRAILFLLFSCGAAASFALSLCKTFGQAFATTSGTSQKVGMQSRMCLAGWSLTPDAHVHSV